MAGRAAVARRPSAADAAGEYGFALGAFKNQRYAEAVSLLEASVKLSAEPANQYRLAMLYLDSGLKT